MAKVTSRIVDTIVLELDVSEAKTLITILKHVGGDPFKSDRRNSDSILRALLTFTDGKPDMPLKESPWYSSVRLMYGEFGTIRDHRVEGDIMFYEPGKSSPNVR